MESSLLVPRQSENFSTAELSPLFSPASPSSPLFYDGSDPSSPSGFKGLLHNTNAMLQPTKPLLSPVLSSRAQFATNMLNELERLNSFEDSNAFSIGFKEESVDLNNMDLFEELADLEYTPPLFASDDSTIEVPKSPIAASPAPMVPSVVPPAAAGANTGLSAEFKSIVESLNIKPTNKAISPRVPAIANKAVSSLGNLLQIAGIPTTTIGDECLVPVEFIGRPTSGGLGAEEAESMDLDGIIISTDMEMINESELFDLGLQELSGELIADESSNGAAATDKTTLVNGVMPYWAKDMTIPLDELDTQMNKNVETLDALLNGDVSTAKNVITSSPPTHLLSTYSPISTVSSEDDDDECSVLETAEVIEVVPLPPQPKRVESQKKPERRGRKPAKMTKDPLTHVRDKALRKKEQNKTAATRYRQKKKQELVATLAEEDDLQKVHDELEKEKEKIGAEVRMIRSLLRDMLQVRKKRSPSSVPISAGRITASSIVQAQKIANRRK